MHQPRETVLPAPWFHLPWLLVPAAPSPSALSTSQRRGAGAGVGGPGRGDVQYAAGSECLLGFLDTGCSRETDPNDGQSSLFGLQSLARRPEDMSRQQSLEGRRWGWGVLRYRKQMEIGYRRQGRESSPGQPDMGAGAQPPCSVVPEEEGKGLLISLRQGSFPAS